MKKKKSLKALIVLIISAISILGAAFGVSSYLGIDIMALPAYFSSAENSSPATEITEPSIEESEPIQYTRKMIDDAVNAWVSGNTSYSETVKLLTKIKDNGNSHLTSYAREQLAFIELEETCRKTLDLAERSVKQGNYTKAFTELNSIDPNYSKYNTVLTLYGDCKNQALQSIADPASEEEFEAAIQLMEDCNALYPQKAFTNRKQSLEEELVVFIDISETIEASTILFDDGQIEESFILLALGLEKYPNDDRLSTTLVDYRDHYIISTTMQAVELCEQEEYKDALQLVESAIAEYDCPEFQALKKAIREEKNFLYRWKNNIVEGFNTITSGWTAEEFDVKQAADDTGAYIVKSGKKLALGDYSDEDITLLSFGGNVAASLLGADVLFDLRDLSYDLTHWGEEEYFAVWLAADMVALLPVIGVVKYLSHFKTAANGVDAATDLVDSVADVSKNADNAADLVDAVSDVTKTGVNIVNAIDNAKDTVKSTIAAKEISKYVAKGYTLVETRNQKLLGKIHADSGVEYGLSRMEYLDGQKLIGTFPKFESFATIQLPEHLYKSSSPTQQSYCLAELKKQIQKPWSSLRKNFTEEQLQNIMDGIQPTGLTWHHNEQEGVMQLVDSIKHDQAKHTGGMKLWGRGY